MEPKVNWEYYYSDKEFNLNPTFEKSNFARVDCILSPKIVYWEPRHIDFPKNWIFGWTDQTLGDGKFLIEQN